MNYNLVRFEASYGTREQLKESELPEIVFSGRSNVGKSSLINAFFGRKNLARVSSSPGKTTTVNFFRVGDVRFADLPGYGYAKRSAAEKKRWASLMEHYFGSGRNIRLIVQLIDIRHAPSADDMQMLQFIIESGLECIIVLTKCDKLNKAQLCTRREELKKELETAGGIPTIEFSSVNGTGVAELRKAIDDLLN